MVEEEKRKQKERAVRRRSGRVGRLLLGFWRRLVWLFLIGGCGGGVMSNYEDDNNNNVGSCLIERMTEFW